MKLTYDTPAQATMSPAGAFLYGTRNRVTGTFLASTLIALFFSMIAFLFFSHVGAEAAGLAIPAVFLLIMGSMVFWGAWENYKNNAHNGDAVQDAWSRAADIAFNAFWMGFAGLSLGAFLLSQ